MLTGPRSERFPEEHICPRRVEIMSDRGKSMWRSDDSCSFCGSLHPDVLMERLEAETVTIVPTDKDYKIYVRANQGTPPLLQTYRDGDVWITRETTQEKFYFQHLSTEQMQRFVDLLNTGKIALDYPHRFYVKPYFIRYDKPAES